MVTGVSRMTGGQALAKRMGAVLASYDLAMSGAKVTPKADEANDKASAKSGRRCLTSSPAYCSIYSLAPPFPTMFGRISFISKKRTVFSGQVREKH